jgi:hypothetical protein
MADPHVISALREKRAIVAGLIEKLERKLAQQRLAATLANHHHDLALPGLILP